MDPMFVTGGTGYLGRALIEALRERGYMVHALVRPGSEAKLPSAALPVIGNALDASIRWCPSTPPSDGCLRPVVVRSGLAS